MSDQSQTIFRVHREERDKWTSIVNASIRDSRLSFKATGMLVYLLSLPGEWKVNLVHLAGVKSDGRDSVASALKELVEFGYVTKEQVRDENGRISGVIWNVFEASNLPETANPYTDKPNTGLPNSEKPPLRKTDGNKELKKERASGPAIPQELMSIQGFEKEWAAFMVHRKKLRKPMTDRAIELSFEKLLRTPEKAVQLLRTSIERGWVSFDATWGQGNGKHPLPAQTVPNRTKAVVWNPGDPEPVRTNSIRG